MGSSSPLRIIEDALEPSEIQQIILLFQKHSWKITESYLSQFNNDGMSKLVRGYLEDRLVSLLCYSNYGTFSWIGYSFTDPNFRKHGLNGILKRVTLSNAPNLPTYLVCDDHLVDHNTKLGFQTLGTLIEFSFIGSGDHKLKDSSCSAQQIFDFDRLTLGGTTRSGKLLKLIESPGSKLFTEFDFNKCLAAYAILSKINGVYRLGPLVFHNLDAGIRLLQQILNDPFVNSQTVVFYSFEKYTAALTAACPEISIKGEYNLMCNSSSTKGIENQLTIYGRATG